MQYIDPPGGVTSAPCWFSAPALACLTGEPPAAPAAAGDWQGGVDDPQRDLQFVTLLHALRASGGLARERHLLVRWRSRQGEGIPVWQRAGGAASAIGFEWGGERWLPMFQFQRDELHPLVVQLLAELPAGWDGWRLVFWFADPEPGLGGRRPVDLLDGDAAPLLQAARHAFGA